MRFDASSDRRQACAPAKSFSACSDNPACFPHGDVPDPAFRRHLNDNFDHIASALREVDGTKAFIIHDLKLLATTL